MRYVRLLFATTANHLQIRHGHMAVLGGTFVDTVFSGLRLGVFLGSVQGRIRNRARDRNRMSKVLSEINAVALHFPRAAIFGRELILISIFLHAAGHSAGILVRLFLRVVRLCPGATEDQRESKYCAANLELHVSLRSEFFTAHSHVYLNLRLHKRKYRAMVNLAA